ncbi:uncharacterized protein METZ01_LOCUS181349 [marine metagenome]|uniref:Uncharacterized protein n=1 Tax=marine metagenome TaxID=408172 RepID=A0A382CQX2_9ZZZZ
MLRTTDISTEFAFTPLFSFQMIIHTGSKITHLISSFAGKT